MKEQLDLERLPQHVAIIMDGNGRWAKQRGAKRVFGHQNAIQAVRESTEFCAELGIPYLTLYAFSTENWNRPQIEVSALMRLLISTIRKETKTLMKNDVRLNAVGNIAQLPADCREELREAMEMTQGNSRMVLTLALSYSGRWDIVEAARQLAQQAAAGTLRPEDIDDQRLAEALSTGHGPMVLPDVELMIRTSGELRISNFLLWQLAYAELYFTEVLWPDFRKQHLLDALASFQNRERRFGQTSEQLTKKA
jgi:undecaprenyl diphosphate synthase